MVIVCKNPECGKEFSTTNGRKKFCCDRCRIRYKGLTLKAEKPKEERPPLVEYDGEGEDGVPKLVTRPFGVPRSMMTNGRVNKIVRWIERK